jgi:hypothetical protein
VGTSVALSTGHAHDTTVSESGSTPITQAASTFAEAASTSDGGSGVGTSAAVSTSLAHEITSDSLLLLTTSQAALPASVEASTSSALTQGSESASAASIFVTITSTVMPTTQVTSPASAWATETAAETTVSAGPAAAVAAILFTAVLPLSVEAFDAVRPAYVQAVATAATCSPEQVFIVSISAVGSAGVRRADTQAVAIETKIVLPAAAAVGAEAQGAPSSGALSAVDIRVSLQDLDRSLQRYGLPQALSFRVLATPPGTAAAAAPAASPNAAEGGNGTAANSTTAAGGSGGGSGMGVLSVIVGCSVAGAVVMGAVAVRALRVQARKSCRISHFTSLEAVGGGLGGGGSAWSPERGGSGASYVAVADVELASEMVAEVGVWEHVQVGGKGMGALGLHRAAYHSGIRMGTDDPLSSNLRMQRAGDFELGDTSAVHQEAFSRRSLEECCSQGQPSSSGMGRADDVELGQASAEGPRRGHAVGDLVFVQGLGEGLDD